MTIKDEYEIFRDYSPATETGVIVIDKEGSLLFFGLLLGKCFAYSKSRKYGILYWYNDMRGLTALGCTVINLEQGMPTVEVARQKLEQAIRTARARRTTTLKIIHGYGSSGKGGAIKRDVQQVLAGKLRAGEIRGYVAGENFSPFDSSARAMIDRCPELRSDKDYSRGNDGITIILI